MSCLGAFHTKPQEFAFSSTLDRCPICWFVTVFHAVWFVPYSGNLFAEFRFNCSVSPSLYRPRNSPSKFPWFARNHTSPKFVRRQHRFVSHFAIGTRTAEQLGVDEEVSEHPANLRLIFAPHTPIPSNPRCSLLSFQRLLFFTMAVVMADVSTTTTTGTFQSRVSRTRVSVFVKVCWVVGRLMGTNVSEIYASSHRIIFLAVRVHEQAVCLSNRYRFMLIFMVPLVVVLRMTHCCVCMCDSCSPSRLPLALVWHWICEQAPIPQQTAYMSTRTWLTLVVKTPQPSALPQTLSPKWWWWCRCGPGCIGRVNSKYMKSDYLFLNPDDCSNRQ